MWNEIKVIESSDANVKKFVFTKKDAVAESVLYKYPTYEDRTVICCSTMSGCNIGCRFCGAGDYFVRSLSSDEIIDQPVHLLEHTGVVVEKIKRLQIMFMSMGEPLLNLKNLMPALKGLYEKFPNAALLISTIGPDIGTQQWAKFFDISCEIDTIGLQFSVHESTDEARNKLIPFDKKLSLYDIATIGSSWNFRTGRKTFFNYCVHEKNGTVQDADRLYTLFDPKSWNATISVICERNENVAAANERQRELAESFQRLLMQRGFNTRMFDPAGQNDSGSGCGQLWFVQKWMRENPHLARPSIGNGLPIVHAPRMF